MARTCRARPAGSIASVARMSEATSGITISTSGPGFRGACHRAALPRRPGGCIRPTALYPPFYDLHVKTKLLSRIKPMIPVQSLLQKYSGFPNTQISAIASPSPPNKEGRFAIVTNVGRGMRWTRVAPGRKRCSRTEKSCGPDTLTLVSSWRRQTADDGGKRARLTGESAKEAVTLSRAGMPDVSGEPVVTNSCVFLYFTREAAGALGARHSPRPPWAEATGKTRADRAAGMRNCICCLKFESGMALRSPLSSPAKAGDPVFQRPMMESRGRGVLDTRLRGYDSWWLALNQRFRPTAARRSRRARLKASRRMTPR
jgi:hypothetical protein